MTAYTVWQIIAEAKERRASDIHIARDVPVKLRIDGALSDFNEAALTPGECAEYAKELLGGEELPAIGERDVSLTTQDGIRCRANVYRERGSVSAAIRLLNDSVPTREELGLPPVVDELILKKQGIVLVTGQTGSGKSTTLAYLVDRINRTQSKHIITIEDPIEYVHSSLKSMVSQREVGSDTRSYADALNSALREDPDVIMLGELRSLTEIEAALTIAETGHLVLSSLHTNSAAETVDRIVDVFPTNRQSQIRLQLSMTLNAVICQQLLPHICGRGRVLATEVMMMSGAIGNLIREGKTPQIENSIATSADIGSYLMDSSLISLYRQCRISRDETVRAAHDREYVFRTVR